MSPGCFPTATGAAALTHAFQQVRVVVESVLAIALVAGLRVHALALLAYLRPKQYAFIDVTVGWDAIVDNVVVLGIALPVWAEAVELS